MGAVRSMTAIESPSSVRPAAANSATVSRATLGQEGVELRRGIELRDRRGLFREAGARGAPRGGTRGRLQDGSGRPVSGTRSRAQRGPARARFRRHGDRTIIVPTIAKGAATMSRIDQYMPRHIEAPPAWSASEAASLHSGHAAASAGTQQGQRAGRSRRRAGPFSSPSPYPNRAREGKAGRASGR